MTDYLNRPLSEYLDDAASGKPTPGGGSVAGLVGALATTMGSMAANFTTGKEKYRSVEPRVQSDLGQLEQARRKFLDLMHRDMEAYEGVMAAYRLPKGSDEEKQKRRAAIQEALNQALLVPLKAGRVAVQVLETADDLANIANVNLLSDVAVAAILAEATFAACRVNVEVNLAGLKDEAMVKETRTELNASATTAARLKESCLDSIRTRSG